MPIYSNSRGKSKFSICMRCQWHRIHGACGIIETAYTMHSGSLTPHAQCRGGGSLSRHAKWNFRTTSTIEILRQNGFTMKKFKMHTVSMTPHAKYDTACTLLNQRTIRAAIAAFKGNIYLKKYIVAKCPIPPLQKYVNLKGLPPNKKFSSTQCYWHRMYDFCVQKSIIFRRIRSRIQKGFSSVNLGPRGYC
jgi:hypothetical protein